MGFFDFLFGKKKDEEVTHFGFVSDKEGKGLTHEQAQDLQEELLKTLGQNDKSKAVNIAATLMMKKDYEGCIQAYTQIAQHFPAESATAKGQIGAAYYFKGEYETAIQYYLEALAEGAPDFMMDDNVWEACEALIEKTADKAWADKYLQYFPNGSHLKAAKKALA